MTGNSQNRRGRQPVPPKTPRQQSQKAALRSGYKDPSASPPAARRQGREYRFSGSNVTSAPRMHSGGAPKAPRSKEAIRQEQQRREAARSEQQRRAEKARRRAEHRERAAARPPALPIRLFDAIYRSLKQKLGAIRSVLLMVAALYLLFTGCIVGLRIGKFYGNTRSYKPVTVTVGRDGKEKTDKTVKQLRHSAVFRSGDHEPYVDFTAIAEECALLTVGSNKQIRFILPDRPEESILFIHGSPIVQIGSTRVELPAPVEIQGRTVYLPISFLSRYVTGYTVTYDAAQNSLTVLRKQEPNLSTEQDPVYQPFGLCIYGRLSLDPISTEDS